MERDYSWEIIENAGAENRELGRVIRELEGLHKGDTQVDWKESRLRCRDILTAYRETCDKSSDLAVRLRGRKYVIGGDEHHIIDLSESADRVYKITFGDNFGAYPYFSPFDPDLTGKHFHGTGCEDPIYYLRRWMLLNALSDYQTHFEGILPPEEKLMLPRICVSQPFVSKEDPPSLDEIAREMGKLGFAKISQDAFLHTQARILITDAAPRNVRVINGGIVLFDAIAEVASERVLSWARDLLVV